ncbi:hypothetical protein KJ903_03805 [Patescibacteria group bacterium]|nr:hypothetical protein [Patescibacteria group bacterium]
MTYTTLLKKYWYLVVIVVVLVTIGSFVISIVQKPEYRSSVRVLVIQKQAGQLDAYTAARSAETVAGILSKMIYTSTFFDQVMDAGFKVEKSDFSNDLEKRKQEWEKAVVTRVVEDSGTLEVNVYDQDQRQAEQLAYAIAYVMISKGDQYHGGAGQIEIKMVDNPVTSDKPVRPNVMRNTGAGFLLGLLASLSIMFLISERLQRRPAPAGLEAVTMPKPKEIKKWQKEEKQSTPQPPKRPPQRIKKQPVQQKKADTTAVKNRFANSLASNYQAERDIPYDLPQPQQSPPTEQKNTVPTAGAQQRQIKSKLADGMKKISPPPQRAKLEPGEVVYQLDRGRKQDDQGKVAVPPADDKYSPDRVDKWIKTGKFE